MSVREAKRLPRVVRNVHGAADGVGSQVLMTRVGLRIPPALSFDDWERAGRRIADLVDSSGWWLGDWLVFGREHYPDRYQRAIRAVGLSYQTLRNYAWVAGRFEFGRRRAALTFQHHAEIASLSCDVQERLLDQAERHAWTTKQLRTALRAERDGDAPPSGPPARIPRIALPQDRVDVWRQAAESLGLDLEHWVMRMLDQAAERTLANDAPPGL